MNYAVMKLSKGFVESFLSVCLSLKLHGVSTHDKTLLDTERMEYQHMAGKR